MSPNIAKLIPGPAAEPRAARARTVDIPLRRLERDGVLAQPGSQTPMADAFRQAKRPLLENVMAPDGLAERRTLIMVTSALAGEGKTFCALNLALTLAAEIDTEVLLVDADVLQPQLLQRLGVRVERGLLDLLMHPELALEDMVLRTNVNRLSLLGAGTAHALSTELLASAPMDRLLSRLAARDPGRLVVFDAPPLLSSTEAQVLATRVGQVVLVIEASRTPTAAVTEALATLDSCEVVLPLLNKTRQGALATTYGRTYGRKYGPTSGRTDGRTDGRGHGQA